ncbi:MAG TPA: MG2 domain-containing protein, partial [Alphaproteobacteria bacterium]|nr:MG2 domain-containing protein [Alphaproteobacteria bacterium]
GVYVAIAQASGPAAADRPAPRAAQWFVVSDIGLTAITGEQGLTVFARRLSTAQAAPGVRLVVYARSNAQLAEGTTGPDGTVRFARETLGGSGDDAPGTVFAYGQAPAEGGKEAGQGADFSFLDLAGGPTVDLSGRGADGRGQPGEVDAYAFSDRGIYRPGETVYLTALLRTAASQAVGGKAVVFDLTRPDGTVLRRDAAREAGSGGYLAAIALPPAAPLGAWKAVAYLEGSDQPLATVAFTIGNFTPPRLSMGLEPEQPVLRPGSALTVKLEARYQFGAAAADLPGQAAVTVRPAGQPFAPYQGWQFGLAQDEVEPKSRDLGGFVTDARGNATLTVTLPDGAEAQRPLEAALLVTVIDQGGRPVQRELVLPVRQRPVLIGLHPTFQGEGVAGGATAGFEVVALDAEGRRVAKPNLSYDLIREEYDFRWFEKEGRWDYETVVRDQRVAGGSLSLTADKPGLIQETVAEGRYRLEVVDPESGAASSIRFSGGVPGAARAGPPPDTVLISFDRLFYGPGETAKALVRPPFDGEALVAVVDGSVRSTFTAPVKRDGTTLDIPVPDDLTAGAYVVVTAYAPSAAATRERPNRAVGSAWLALDRDPHTLGLAWQLPDSVLPRQRVTLPLDVSGAVEGESAFVAVTAVDERVLALTRAGAPQPVEHFLGQRRLGVTLRDSFGRLLQPEAGDYAPDLPSPAPALPPRGEAGTTQPVALFSGALPVGANGRVEVPLQLPDFQGRLRLVAVAWSPGKLGQAQATLTVREPAALSLGLPGFLRSGDVAESVLALRNQTDARADFTAEIQSAGAVTVEERQVAFKEVGAGGRAAAVRNVRALGPGTGSIAVDVAGPGEAAPPRQASLPVATVAPTWARRSFATVEPGQDWAPPAEALAGLQRDASRLWLAVGTVPLLDAPGLLSTAPPMAGHGVEGLVAAAMPLLYHDDALFAEGAAPRRERIAAAIASLAALQRADGGFAPWSPEGEADPWLTAFALDFLQRARAEGHGVPEPALSRGLRWLGDRVGQKEREAGELAARAYAFQVLMRAKAGSPDAVKVFADAHADSLPTAASRSRLAWALALAGDPDRGRAIARERIGPSLGGPQGSALADGAAALAILAESELVERDPLVERARGVQTAVAAIDAPTLRERTWLLLASHALKRLGGTVNVAIDAEAGGDRPAPLLQPVALGARMRNLGQAPVHVALSAVGPAEAAPAKPLWTVARTLRTLKGETVEPNAVKRGQLLVVELTAEAAPGAARTVVLTDPLPAAFEIENLRVPGEADWLSGLNEPLRALAEPRRFLAALPVSADSGRVRTAYLVRALTAGQFSAPAPYVFDGASDTRLSYGQGATIQVRPE